MPPISDQDMNTMLQDFSSQHQSEFYNLTALNELYFCYACKCKDEVSITYDIRQFLVEDLRL